MKFTLLTLVALSATVCSSFSAEDQSAPPASSKKSAESGKAAPAHSHPTITLGPKGGRLLKVNTPGVENVELFINKEGAAEITLLNKEGQPVPLEQQSVAVTAGPRATAKKLTVEKKAQAFVTSKLPEGKEFPVVIQLKETATAKAQTLRLALDLNVCPECQKPEYVCQCDHEAEKK